MVIFNYKYLLLVISRNGCKNNVKRRQIFVSLLYIIINEWWYIWHELVGFIK
jgi:hypothetical protein